MKRAAAWKRAETQRRLRWIASAREPGVIVRGLVGFVWWLAIQGGHAARVLMAVPAEGGGGGPTGPTPPDMGDEDTRPHPGEDGALRPFPDEFLWGAATAAMQTEGCIANSDWSLFTSDPDIRERVENLSAVVNEPFRLQPIGTAVHHGDLKVLAQDLDRAVLLGLNAYRFSIEWARVVPDDTGAVDPVALKFYSDAVDLMVARKLEPIVTLNHISLPSWILTPPVESKPGLVVPTGGLFPDVAAEDEGWRNAQGWEDAKTIDAFIDFVEAVVSELKDRVKFWVTFNEPSSTAAIGYLGGVWPPGFSLRGDKARTVYFNLLKAHSRAFQAIKTAYQDAESHVGVAMAIVHFSVSSETFAPAVVRGLVVGALVGAAIGAIAGIASALGLGIFAALFPPAAGAIAPILIASVVLGAAVGAIVGGALGLLFAAGREIFSSPHQRARDQADYFYNRHFLDSITKSTVDTAIRVDEGERDEQDAATFFGLDSSAITPQLDFIGVNYYRNGSVHFEDLLNDNAPFTGGAVLSSDLRHTKDPLTRLPVTEAHNLLNDMGWDTYPEGMRTMLGEMGDYGRPVIITENGHAEENDRNRAPQLIAHLKQIRLAMNDGVDVRGYCYWSLVDNYEWAEGYNPRARFGLFEVERTDGASPLNSCSTHGDGASFKRHITEGAIAYQYFIANNASVSDTEDPFAAAVERFGEVSPDGRSTTPPTRQAGALWNASTTRAGRPAPFRLYLSKLGGAGWTGMIFQHSADPNWIRLTGSSIVVTRDLAGRSHITFSHPVKTVLGTVVLEGTRTFSATTALATGSEPFPALEGTVRDKYLIDLPSDGSVVDTPFDDEPPAPGPGTAWSGTRDLTVGLWEDTTTALTLLAVRNWEGRPFSEYRVKYLMEAPEWQPRRATTVWSTASQLDVSRVRSFEAAPSTLRTLTATRSGTQLRGTLVDRSEAAFSWTAVRVQEDVDF